MNQIVYFLADLYPWWGIPLAFILLELANVFRRRGKKCAMFFCVFSSAIVVGLAVLYFISNGVQHLRPSLYEFEKTYIEEKK